MRCKYMSSIIGWDQKDAALSYKRLFRLAVSNMTKPPNRVPSDHDRMTNRKSKAFSITSPPPPLIHGAVEVKQKLLKAVVERSSLQAS